MANCSGHKNSDVKLSLFFKFLIPTNSPITAEKRNLGSLPSLQRLLNAKEPGDLIMALLPKGFYKSLALGLPICTALIQDRINS